VSIDYEPLNTNNKRSELKTVMNKGNEALLL